MDEISIFDPEFDGRRLISKISVPKELRKYVLSSSMFVHYDVDVSSEESILNIPMLATVLPLAWLTGYDIHVGELDRAFKESLDGLQQDFMKMFPEAHFGTRINADMIIENESKLKSEDRTGLLFSGGVDSTYSLLSNLDLKPKLIMYWGVEGYPYPKYTDYWEKVISTYSEFARRMGLTLHIIKTNPLEVLHHRRIEHDFHKQLYDGTLWGRLQHSLVLLPLTAPLSIGRFDQLLIASSAYPGASWIQVPTSRRPETDERISWAHLQVRHDGAIPKSEKIMGHIAEFLRNDKLLLRVCLNRRHEQKELNCGYCLKCITTIIDLFLAGVDPSFCGFNFNNTELEKMKSFFKNEKVSRGYIDLWKEVQIKIPYGTKYDVLGFNKFLKWFKEYNLNSMEKNVWIYRDIYHKLPFTIAKVLNEVYEIMGIKIFEHTPVRPSPKHNN